jgi:hypothetical protein
MSLNDYPSKELAVLSLAVGIANQYGKVTDPSFPYDILKEWSKRINEAYKDALFEERRNESNPRQCSLFQLQISR